MFATDFTDFEWSVPGASIRGFKGGDGPPLLLLHGSGHSSQLWQAIAGRLAARHAIVVPDIVFEATHVVHDGHGTSHSAPAASAPDERAATRVATVPGGHRDIAAAQLAMMEAFGFGQFMICAHGEGARVAQRLALDHGSRVERMMVLDTVPTLPPDDADADDLLQAESLHEEADRMLARGDLERGEKIACPVRVLWGGQGAWTLVPLDGWRKVARDTSGRALECVPCIPEHAPDTLLDEMSRFFDARAC